MPPGLYLKLLHGRTDPEARMQDWGFDGPWIGPLKWVHVTYLNNINLGFNSDSCTGPMTSSDPLYFIGAFVFYEGKYYGDWDISFVEGSRHD